MNNMEKKILIIDKTIVPETHHVYSKIRSKQFIDKLINYAQKDFILIDNFSNFSLIDFLMEYKSQKSSYKYIEKYRNLNKQSQIQFCINDDSIKLFFANGRYNDYCIYLSINEKFIIPVTEELVFKLFNSYIAKTAFNGEELYNSIYRGVYQPQLRSRGIIDHDVFDDIKKVSKNYKHPGVIRFLFTLVYYLMIREEQEDDSKNPFKSQLIMLLVHKILIDYSDDTDIKGICHNLCTRASSGDEEEQKQISNECSDADIEYRKDDPYVYIRKKVPIYDHTGKIPIVYIVYEDEAIHFTQYALMNTPEERPRIDISKLNINPYNVNVGNIITNNEDTKELAKEFNSGSRSINFSLVNKLKEQPTTGFKFKDYEDNPELHLNVDSIVSFSENYELKIFFAQGRKDEWAALIAYRGKVFAVTDEFYFEFVAHAARKYSKEKLLLLFDGIYNLMMRENGLYRAYIDKQVVDYIDTTCLKYFSYNAYYMKFFATEIYYCMIAEEHYKNEEKGITEPVCGCSVKMAALYTILGGEKIIDDNEIPSICKGFCSCKGKSTSQDILKICYDNNLAGIIKTEHGYKRNVVSLAECIEYQEREEQEICER